MGKKLSETEKMIRAAEKEMRRQERAARKEALRVEKEARKAEKVVEEKTEEELVHEYANKVIKQKASRGHYDERFSWHKSAHDASGKTVNKNLWMDTDFFFSVVFQSIEQKTQFIEFLRDKFGLTVNVPTDHRIQIVNGLTLAQKMGLDLKPETGLDYPYGNLELRELVLDTDKF